MAWIKAADLIKTANLGGLAIFLCRGSKSANRCWCFSVVLQTYSYAVFVKV